MLLPNPTQSQLFSYYKNLDWEGITLNDYSYGKRISLKHDILQAIAFQFKVRRIKTNRVINSIGLPDQVEGSLYNGLLFYTYRHLNALGLYGMMVFSDKGYVRMLASNRMDLFTGRITRKRLVKHLIKS